MSLDLFLRAETPAALRTVVKSQPFQNVIGDLTDPDEPSQIRERGGVVDFQYFPPDTVPDGQGGHDSWCWLHLRLSRAAEQSDNDPDGQAGTDRWNKSRIVRWMRENGTFRIIRGVRVFEYTLGNGDRVQLWRGSDMESLGLIFHRYLGGNSY